MGKKTFVFLDKKRWKGNECPDCSSLQIQTFGIACHRCLYLIFRSRDVEMKMLLIYRLEECKWQAVTYNVTHRRPMVSDSGPGGGMVGPGRCSELSARLCLAHQGCQLWESLGFAFRSLCHSISVLMIICFFSKVKHKLHFSPS